MGPTPFYGARAEKPPQKANFAMKQTNICHLSSDIITEFVATSDGSCCSCLVMHLVCRTIC